MSLSGKLIVVLGALFLFSIFCGACVTSVTAVTIQCGGPNCTQTITIIVPSGQGPTGYFPVLGYLSCCSQNIQTVTGVQPGCHSVEYKAPATRKQYLQLANILAPDCRGRYVRRQVTIIRERS